MMPLGGVSGRLFAACSHYQVPRRPFIASAAVSFFNRIRLCVSIGRLAVALVSFLRFFSLALGLPRGCGVFVFVVRWSSASYIDHSFKLTTF